MARRSSPDGSREWVSQLITSQQVHTLFQNSVRKRKSGDAGLPEQTITNMVGDAIEPALLNVKRYRTITAAREAADMEMEWTVLEHELDEMILQNCEKGKWDITLHLGCIDHRYGGFETGQLCSLKEWMVEKIMERLKKKGFSKLAKWSDTGEDNEDLESENVYLHLSWK